MKAKTLNRIKEMVKPHKKTIAFVIVMSIIIDLIILFKPYLIGEIINIFEENNISSNNLILLQKISILYIVCVIIEAILNYISSVKTNLLGENVVFSLRNKLFKYMENANISFHDKVPSGKWFVRIVSDSEDVYALFTEVITTIVKDIFIIIGLLIAMVYISVELSMINLIIIPALIIITTILTKMLDKVYRTIKAINTKINTFFSESIYGINVIKIFNRQDEKQKECNNLTHSFERSKKHLGILHGLLPSVAIVIENIGIALVAWAVLHKFGNISLDVGIIYIFVTYIKNIFEPINRIVESIEVVGEAIASIDKIYEILEEDSYVEDFSTGKRVDKLKGKIEFKNVWFAYEKDNWVLKDVSFTINPGESIALVGKTGSGKTTITNLINKFYTIQKGEILIDGININDINLSDLRRNIGTILQDPFIYAKSIKDNVRLFNEMDDGKIKEAVKMSSADVFVNELEHGIDEIAEERGSSFSAGEKQLLAFARIFALNPSIFILDEATANIDTTTEELVQKSVDKLSKEKTSIFIAHRLATIVNVDKIIVLSNGEIIEQGSHEQLVKSEGYYSKLYKAYYNSLV